MEDGVVGVLPALVYQPIRGVPEILDETVAIPVPITFHPAQGRLDIGPDRLDEVTVVRPLVICPSEHDEERGGVDSAVVAAEWDLAKGSHFAFAGFVQDLTRLCISTGVDLIRLGRGQDARTPRANPGSIHRHASAVMRPSRPKGVLNQGMPA